MRGFWICNVYFIFVCIEGKFEYILVFIWIKVVILFLEYVYLGYRDKGNKIVEIDVK